MTNEPRRPSRDEIESYCAGGLDPKRFEEIDRWLASLPDDEQMSVLVGSESQPSQLAADAVPPHRVVFASEVLRSRYESVMELGRGGMGTVDLLRDRLLDREVALKRFRARGIEESMDAYLSRMRAFKREATITAGLEHPGIVPVHDIGIGVHGQPAFVMKRLSGTSMATVLLEQSNGIGVTRAATIIGRVAEAIGYAHAHDVVHRDLKPENVILGLAGEVTVIDWGLACVIGSEVEAIRAGTPAWMAPEQSAGSPADPRMDVFALGALLLAALTGQPLRLPDRSINVAALHARATPKALEAVVRRCLCDDPARRYASGSEVAAELTRWLTSGITQAQEPSWLRRALVASRQHPMLLGVVATTVAAAFGMMGWLTWHRHLHRQELDERASTIARNLPLDDHAALVGASREVADLTREYPDSEVVRMLSARLQAAIDTQDTAAAHAALVQHLQELATRYRRRGPQATDIPDLLSQLRATGLALDGSPIDTDAQRIQSDPNPTNLLRALAQLEHALLQTRDSSGLVDSIPRLLKAAGPTVGWQALGALLTNPQFAAHDLVFAGGSSGELVLSEPAVADEVLAIFGPHERLVAYARSRVAASPGSFWPRVIMARAALQSGDTALAMEHALVALGAEPDSLWPHLALAYVALAENDLHRLSDEVAVSSRISPDHVEVAVLAAVLLARTGHLAEAQARVDRIDAHHLQYHLQHPIGHPMEKGVAALVEAGVTISHAEPNLGPLVPPAP